MAEYGELTFQTFTAGADLSAQQFNVMRGTTVARQCNIASHALAAAELGPVGVLWNAPQSGEAATIATAGRGKVRIGASVTANKLLSVDGSGRAITAVSGSLVFARAVTGGGAEDIITADLIPMFRLSGAN